MPDRSDELKGIFRDAFLARSDYIPLMVNSPCGKKPTFEQLWHDTSNAVAQAAEALRPRIDVQADWVPSVNIALYQCMLIPRLYGAEIVMQDGCEPMCRPLFSSIEEAADTAVPVAAGPAVDEMLELIDNARAALPDDFRLSFPVASSPMDLAQLLLKEGFFVGMLDRPAETHRFLDNLAGLLIEVTQIAQGRLGQEPDGYVTNRGMFFPGFRLPCDAIVNLSPDLIRRFVFPVLRRIHDAFGPLCIHLCTEPAYSAHVLPVLLECDAVLAVDNWQGPDVFLGDAAPARFQAKVAVVGNRDLTTAQKMDDFLVWAPVREVPRKAGRGLVMATGAESVDDGRRIYDEWRHRFE